MGPWLSRYPVPRYGEKVLKGLGYAHAGEAALMLLYSLYRGASVPNAVSNIV